MKPQKAQAGHSLGLAVRLVTVAGTPGDCSSSGFELGVEKAADR